MVILPIDDGDMERRDAAIDPALGVPAFLGRSEQMPAGGGSPLLKGTAGGTSRGQSAFDL